ncbi:MAG: SMC-Scp complex subunit ScpB, partial [Phycisphaerae bacterium]
MSLDERGRLGEPHQPVTAQRVVEAILFAADGPLSAARIAEIAGAGGPGQVKKHIDSLNRCYEEMGCAFRIEAIAGGYQMLTLPEYGRWISKLRRVRAESKLSAAALETLAVVAYRQPVLRADIEAIRGVSVGEVLN